MRAWFGTIAAALLLGVAMAGAQSPPAKLALVIGNADYDRDGRLDRSPEALARAAAQSLAPDLINAAHDAADMRDALARLGYDVDYVENADLPAIEAAAQRLVQRASAAPGAKVVMYYAGHGVKVDGYQYLIPVGVATPASLPPYDQIIRAGPNPRVAAAMKQLTYAVPDLLAALPASGAGGFSLVLVDACGDNPWYRFNGAHLTIANLAQGLIEAGYRRVQTKAGVAAVFAGGGGPALDGAGRNSPLVTAVLPLLTDPGPPVGALVVRAAREVMTVTNGVQTPDLMLDGQAIFNQPFELGARCLARCE